MALSATEEWRRLLVQAGHGIQIGNSNQDTDVPVEHQVALLGLDPAQMQGEHLFDLACGKGMLVQWLRERGVNAYGIDSRAPTGTYFTPRMVTGTGQQYGLPVARGSLHYVTSFQNLAFNDVFRMGREIWVNEHNVFGLDLAEQLYAQYVGEANAMIAEIGRVLLPQGQARIYPVLFDTLLPPREELHARHGLIRGYEPVNPQDVLAYMHSEGHHTVTPETLKREDKDLTYRCLLLKI